MRLEECVTCEELYQDASNAPNIARITPSQVEYNLRCSVVPGRNDGRVVLVIKGCRSKVNQSDLRVKEDSPLACNALHRGR